MSFGNEKEYKPKYANTAEELIFLTDTGQEDYPVYLLPTREVIYKRKPETEKFAVFHVKKVEEVLRARASSSNELNKIISDFPSLPIKEIINVCVDVVGSSDVYVFSKKVIYEVYMGDYEQMIGEFAVPFVSIRVDPHYSKHATSKQQFAITFSTLKRIVSKLPENIRAFIEKRAYVDTDRGYPFVKIKLPVPTPEFEKVFSDVLAKLTAVQTEEEKDTEGEEEEIPEEVVKKIEEVVKPQELEVELEQPVIVPSSTASTAVALQQLQSAPSKPELVKVYLLSMRLPSKYLVQSVEYNASKTSVREVRLWDGENAKKASRLEGIRREAYNKVSRIFCHVEEYGTWIAVTEQALEEAKKVSDFVIAELKKLGINDTSRYAVKAIPIFLSPEFAKDLLSAAVHSLSRDVEALSEKIKEAEKEQNKSALKRLEKEKSYREALLATFKTYLAQLG